MLSADLANIAWGVPVIVGALQRDRIAQWGGVVVGALMLLAGLGYVATSLSMFPSSMFTGLGSAMLTMATVSVLSPFLLLITPAWRRVRYNVVLGPVAIEMAGKLPAEPELTIGELDPVEMDDRQLITEASIRVAPDSRLALLLGEVMVRWHAEGAGDRLAEPDGLDDPRPQAPPPPVVRGPVDEQMFWSGQTGYQGLSAPQQNRSDTWQS